MKHAVTAVVIGLALAAGSAQAADIAAGKAKAATCVACHGTDGISFAPNYPNLKGQKAAYLVKQLKEFRSGARKDPVMEAQAKPLTDADIDNLAAYYAGLK